jgi:signal recognition particle receptor subunit beta
MALFNEADQTVVVRLVYAGPPLAGKTESVRALAGMLLGKSVRETVFTPGEAQGRTLYFDWVDYIGGSFNGNRIRCQIVSTPGQDALAERRRFLLQGADGVVFVIDSSPAGIEQAARSFQEMLPWITRPDHEPPLDVIVQANKRDLPEALPLSEIKNRFGEYSGLRVIETTATAGTGIRESFVMCVGSALTRIRALMEMGKFLTGQPEIMSGADLLAQLDALEQAAHPEDSVPAADSALDSITISQVTAVGPLRSLSSTITANPADDRLAGKPRNAISDKTIPAPLPCAATLRPQIPNSKINAGTIWPPITGRLAMHEISRFPGEPWQQADGSWCYKAGHWHLLSPAAGVFDSQAEALRVLLAQAHWHISLETVLSPNRCLALAPASPSRWRLWSIFRAEKNLAEALDNELQNSPASQLADKLVEIAHLLLQAVRTFAQYDTPLPASLETVGYIDGQPVYIGFLPTTTNNLTTAAAVASAEIEPFIRQHFSTPVKQTLHQQEINVPQVLRGLQRFNNSGSTDAIIAETFAALLIGQ